MDNANKIENTQSEKDTHKSVQLFLGDELKPLEKKDVSAYDLVSEYEKTKKNRDKSVILWIVACFVVVFLLTYGLIFFIKTINNKIAVNINTFNDLNLRALLDSVGRTESLYTTATKKKSDLVAERESDIIQAQQKRDNDLFTLQSVAKVYSKKLYESKKESILSEYKSTVKEIEKSYSPLIAAAEEEIKHYEVQLSSYEKENLEQIKKENKLLDSQQQLNELEKKNLIAKYEAQISDLKLQMGAQQRLAMENQRAAVEEVRRIYQAKIDLLDPDARNQSEVQDSIILNTGIEKSEDNPSNFEFNETFDSSFYTKGFSSISNNFSDSIKKSSEYLQNLNTIASRFSSIPLENTIKHYVPAMQRLAYQITSVMAEGEQGMQKELDSLNGYISVLNNYLESLCVSKNEICNGIVVDCSNKLDIKLFMTKSSDSYFAKKSFVDGQIRDGKKVIADVTIRKDGEYYSAAPKDPAKVQGFMNGQKIYIIVDNK